MEISKTCVCGRATDIKCSSAVLRQIRHPMIPLPAREFVNRSRWRHFAIALYSRFPSLDPTIAFFRFSICRGILNQIREFRFHPNMAHNQYAERTQAAQRIATPGVGFNAAFTGPQRSPPSPMPSATNITSHPP